MKINKRSYLILVFLSFTILFLSQCIHPKIKFQKAALLDPMMDPAKTEGFYRSFNNEPFNMVEHGTSDPSGAVGGSCPTCG